MLLDLKSITDTLKIDIRGVFHIGAHHGQEMGLYESMGIKNVIMFEPSSLNFNILQKNIGPRAFLVNKALGSKSGTAKMNVEKNNGGMSNSLLDPALHLRQYPHITFGDFEEVSVTTLDEWCNSNATYSDCNAISMDVQGFELEVLIGAKHSLKNIDLIICEVNRDELYKDCAQVIEIDSFLRYHGFRRVITNWEGKTWGDACYIKENLLDRAGIKMPYVSVVDRNFSHSKNVLGFDSACLLPTSRFDWNRNLKDDEEVVVFVDSEIENVSRYNGRHKVAWVVEPRGINPQLIAKTIDLSDKFDVVITHDKDLISSIKNGRYAPMGGAWINPNDWGMYEKNKSVSIIASKKNYTLGHSLRHEASKLVHENDRFGEAYKPIENKLEALKDYKFSIVVENCRQLGFFTEKIIDSLIVGTVPIYWGCSDIGHFFDLRGILTFDSIEDLKKILNSDLNSFYESNIEFIESNAKRARRFASCDDLMFSVLAGIN